jgi:hypothetical protein
MHFAVVGSPRAWHALPSLSSRRALSKTARCLPR